MYLNEEDEDKETLLNKKEKFSQDDHHKIPSFILNQRGYLTRLSLFNVLCRCCRSKYSVDDLIHKEITHYYNLKESFSLPYDEGDETHEDCLKELYSLCFKDKVKDGCRSKEWTVIGFQSDNPRTDFRAAGFSSLLFISFFVKQHEKAFKEMVNFPFFPFALVCIKSTVRILISLHFFEDEKEVDILLRTYGVSLINIKQFKLFLSRQVSDAMYYFKILSFIVLNVYEEYTKSYIESEKEGNILKIENLIKKSFNNLINTELN